MEIQEKPTFIKFPSIKAFNQCLPKLKKKLPTLPEHGVTFTGTTKLHGTNAAIGFSLKTGLWVQSRERIITPKSDNMKFALYVKENEDSFTFLMKEAAKVMSVDSSNEILVIFGEYCGKKIQKNVAISQLPRMFVAFDAFSSQNNEDFIWHDVINYVDVLNNKLCPEILFYNIGQFKTFSICVKSYDKADLKNVRTTLEKITKDVEKLCPAGVFFGIDQDSQKCTTGEGVVWRARVGKDILRFKVKGDEHATSANQRGASLNITQNASFSEFISVVVSDNRCEQALKVIFGDSTCNKEWENRIGEFQKWIVHDVKKEEMKFFPFADDYNGVNGEDKQKEVTKMLNRALSAKSREWFFDYLADNTKEVDTL